MFNPKAMSVKTTVTPSGGQLNILYDVVDMLIGNNNVKTIFEFGSRYGEDTIELAAKFPAAFIYSFECNPKSLSILKEKIAAYRNIVFNENAISDHNEMIEFYQIDEAKTKTTWADGNQGASSIFKASGKYPVEEYHQNLIKVEAITLHSFMTKHDIPFIDVMWMDIQGAELKALMGLGNKLDKVKIIHLEVEFIEIYKEQPLFATIDEYLKQNNFYLAGFTSRTHYSGDAVYVNKSNFNHAQLDKVALLIPKQEKNMKYYLSALFFKFKYFIFKLQKAITK